MAADRNFHVDPHATSQILQVGNNFGKIKTPSRMIIAGPTMSGKSLFALHLVLHQDAVYDTLFKRVLYCLPQDNIHVHSAFIEKLKSAYPGVEIVEGLPDVQELNLTVDNQSKLLIIDDQITKVLGSAAMLQVTK